MTLEKILKYTIISAGIAGALFLFPFFLKLFAPFLASFFIASICQKQICFFEEKWGISRGISSAILVTLMVAAVMGIFAVAVFQLMVQAKNLIASLPDALASFRLQLNLLMQKIDGLKVSLPSEISAFVDSEILKLQNYASDFSGRMATAALNAAGNFALVLPNVLFFAVMFVLGTFFFTKDYVLVINFLNEIFPQWFIKLLSKVRNIILHAFSSYMKAQLYLMLLTAVLVAVCLWITGKEYALLWGLVCGLVDALPVLGTATILVPWSLVALVYGDMYSFVSLLIIQTLVFVVRQLAEPRIISHQIGVHPILTLVSVYIGLHFFGIAGVIFAPVFTLLGVNLYVSYKENAED